MIIKEVIIKNFRSFYGADNHFVFSDSLTLILGDNGDGKTTFFEALEWLLDITPNGMRASSEHISEMRRAELEDGEVDQVLVSMLFDHNGEKYIEKSFEFSREFFPNAPTYKGYKTKGAERLPVNGEDLIKTCFDTFMQSFSMFKGESRLKVFERAKSLQELVDKFSDIKQFDKLVNYASKFEKRAVSAYNHELENDDKVSTNAKRIGEEIEKIDSKLKEANDDYISKKSTVDSLTTQLEEQEKKYIAKEDYEDIKSRLQTQKEIAKEKRGILNKVDYNHCLLDKLWVLCAFPPILNEFQKKCSALSKEKIRLDKEYAAQKARELGKLDAVKEIQGALSNGATELPWYLPDQETMEEMLRDHICKVCGREVEEGSDAYKFMLHKVEEYKAHVEAKLKIENEKSSFEQEELFHGKTVEEIHDLSLSLSGYRESKVASIANQIKTRLDLNEVIRNELKDIEIKIQDLNDEKARLLIKAGNLSEEAMDSKIQDYKGLNDSKNQASIDMTRLEGVIARLEELRQQKQKELDELSPSNSKVKIYRDIQKTISAIASAFVRSKDKNVRRFLEGLESNANNYLDRLSVDDFHGEIRLKRDIDKDKNEIVKICLYSINDNNKTEIKKPSGSQQTVMYISVLFAILDLAFVIREERYPLIFDAATSSFGDSKESYFYTEITQLKNKQCIIVTKDFITKGEVRMKDIDALKCPVYRIRKARGFDPKNLATIRTTIEKLK